MKLGTLRPQDFTFCGRTEILRLVLQIIKVNDADV